MNSWMNMKLIWLELLAIALNTSAAEECGTLDEQNIYNQTHSTALRDYPWTALFSYRDDRKGAYKRIGFVCQGVLISKRLVFTTNYCVTTYIGIELYEVILGDSNPQTARDCDESGQCADAPQVYGIEEIILHPALDKRKHTGDLGMVRLDRDVEFTNYIQPICLPPSSVIAQSDFTSRLVYLAGYLKKQNYQLLPKHKTLVHIVSPDYCQSRFKSMLHIQTEHICGYVHDQLQYISGAGLMDIHVERNKPKFFYLIGVLSYVAIDSSEALPVIFTSAISRLNWIRRNIELS